MASTHTASTLVVSASLAAGGTTTSTSLDLSTKYGAVITAQITNGGTGPSTACVATVNIGAATGGPWYRWAQGTGGLAAGAVAYFGWDVPPGVMFAQVVFTGHTGQAVTVAAQAQALTTI